MEIFTVNQGGTGDTYYVPDNFATIQEALDAAADWDTIIIRDGTYTGIGNRDLDFGGKAITLRSENGPDNCIIDCEGKGRGFYFHNGETPDSVVDGLMITNGLVSIAACAPALSNGGGILCRRASPTITNCTIAGNRAYVEIPDYSMEFGHGGGFACMEGSSPIISNCVFWQNSAAVAGAIYCSYCDLLFLL
jgi:hypothetical protein